jgi:chaperonin cofactor prefoldin
MPEGLKNVGSTFSRMTKQVLGTQLQKNIIAYVDDIVVMSKNEEDHIVDLKETFANLRAMGLKLNLEKCVLASVEERCSGTS